MKIKSNSHLSLGSPPATHSVAEVPHPTCPWHAVQPVGMSTPTVLGGHGPPVAWEQRGREEGG